MRFDLAAIAREAGIKRRVIECRPVEPRHAPELEYRRALYGAISEAARFIRREILPAAAADRAALTMDRAGDRWGGLFDWFRRLLRRWFGAAETAVGRIMDREADRHTTVWRMRVKAALGGIDLTPVITQAEIADPLSIALERNVSLIRSLSDDVAKRVEQAVYQSVIEGGRAKALSARLQHELGVVKSRADLIARDQTAKLVSDLNRIRQQQAGVERYRWSTSQDERVRPTHRANEGKVFEWDDPPAETGHPGHDINCRCVPIAIIEVAEEREAIAA